MILPKPPAIIVRHIASFVRYAASYLWEARLAAPGHTQPIRARYARRLLADLGITSTGPTPEQIAALGPSIFVSNHTSNLDALLICAYFEGDLRILAKTSLFRMPLLGRIMRLERHIPVQRGRNAASRNGSIRDQIRHAIAEGGSVLFFPEGTRTKTGELGKFHRGAFFNAIQTNTPIVPMVVKGAFDAMPKGTLHIKPGHCSLTLLDPIPVPDASAGTEAERAEILAKLTFDAIDRQLHTP